MKLLPFTNALMFVLVLATACGRTQTVSSESEVTLADLQVGTFNMLRYGHGTSKNEDRLARLILATNYHIISGVEIMRSEAAYSLRDRLRDLSGRPWELSLSKFASGESSYKEFFGFYYRADLIKPITSAEGYCASANAVDQTSNGCFAFDRRHDGVPSFERDPFIGQFQVGTHRFAIAAVHVVWGGSDLASVRRRIAELFQIKEVLKNIIASAQGHNVIVAGDFNLALTEDRSGLIESFAERTAAWIPETIFTEIPMITGLVSGPTTVSRSSYDHILYLNQNGVKHLAGSESMIADFDINNVVEKDLFKKEVSDHFPVGVTFRL